MSYKFPLLKNNKNELIYMDNVYTVTQLTKDIRCILEDTFQDIWVEGEISNYTVSSAGHAYFSLKDKNSLINCVSFKGNNACVAPTPEVGMSVLCYGKVSVYDKRGQYQLYVSKLEPRGKGSLQFAFEQLKKKLYEEGLFNEEKKKQIPVFPIHVGIITSPTGAAVKDILKVARRRFPNIEISIRPVRVQGDEAKNEIAQAIEELNEFNRYIAESQDKTRHPIDTIIVGRGGGSPEDLWAFNEEIVARSIYASEIPIVSAVGHEIDYTISDFVADFRAPTPSAAAELVVPLKKEIQVRINKYKEQLFAAAKTKVNFLEKTIGSLRNSYVLRAPMNVFLRMEQQVDDLVKSARSNITHLVELKERDLKTVHGKLQMLSPLSILERGYSITFKEGKVIKSSKMLKEGDILETKFAKGRINSKVE